MICVGLMLGSEELASPFDASRSPERTIEDTFVIRWLEQPDSGSLDAFRADREASIFSRNALALRLAMGGPATSELWSAPCGEVVLTSRKSDNASCIARREIRADSYRFLAKNDTADNL